VLPEGLLNEAAALTVLHDAGIPAMPFDIAASCEEAVAAGWRRSACDQQIELHVFEQLEQAVGSAFLQRRHGIRGLPVEGGGCFGNQHRRRGRRNADRDLAAGISAICFDIAGWVT